ncbi:hypothetical protein CLOP_g3101 [Closterium sp. NIES-67]|nr:hypothetical protein CLOP_g3101 [Closterium sp. NIES-67]
MQRVLLPSRTPALLTLLATLLLFHAASSVLSASALDQESTPLAPPRTNLFRRFLRSWQAAHHSPEVAAAGAAKRPSLWLQYRRHLSGNPADANVDLASFTRYHGDGGPYSLIPGIDSTDHSLDDVATPLGRRRRLQQKTQKGPCTPLAQAIKIPVSSPSDIDKRLQYPNSATVILEVTRDLALPKGLVFSGAFRCTIFRSAPTAKKNFKVTLMGDKEPVIRVWNTSNVIILKLDFWMGVSARSGECELLLDTDIGRDNTCPTIHIWRSHNIQVAKGNVWGRIDVFRAMAARIDSMKVTGLTLFAKSPGVIRVAFSGYGPALLKSWVSLTNNEVYGVDQPIVLQNGAVGVIARNNYIHDFLFAGIRCGADVYNQGDCMLTTISNNLIVASGRNMSGDHDAAGIYYCTHFYNPGNIAECNYIFNGDHCYYLDYATSGVIIRGGACVNTYDGMKVNNGHWNVIEDVILKGTVGIPGWCQCYTPTVNNCAKKPGTYWEEMRIKYYNSPIINRKWPWFKQICQAKTVNGMKCNTDARGTLTGAQTGHCSGLPTHNTVNLIAVNTTDYEMGYRYCERLPTVLSGKFNDHSIMRIQRPRRAAFINYRQNDLGIASKNSVIYTKFPKFKSCPRSDVGPKRVPDAFYFNSYNRPMPWGFMAVIRMGKLHIHDLPGWP